MVVNDNGRIIWISQSGYRGKIAPSINPNHSEWQY